MIRKIILIKITIIIGFCNHLYGDGVFVWNKGVDLYGPSQKAIILYDEGVEDLVLQVKYKGKASDFAWIVPVPSKPKVKAVGGDIFAEISLYTQLRRRWDVFLHRRGIDEEVEVIERKKISVYDVAVLNAKNSQALLIWLNDNGFSIPDKAKQIINNYIKKKWTFVALRIHPDEEKLWVEKSLNEGTLVPLKFTFSSKEIVYPLKISSLNKGETEVLLYVFYNDAVVHPDFLADSPMALEFYRYSTKAETLRLYYSDPEHWKKDRKDFPKSFDFERKFYREVTKDELPLCRKALPRLNDKKFFLSKLRNTFHTEQIQSDIVLKRIEELSKRNRYLFVQKQIEETSPWHEDRKVKVLSFRGALLLRAKEEATEYIAYELEKQGTEKIRCYGAFEFLAHHPSEQALKVVNKAAAHTNEQIRSELVEALYWTTHTYGLDKKFVPILKTLAEKGHKARVQEILNIMNNK